MEKTYIGTIKAKEPKTNNGFTKYVVEVKENDANTCFLEFRNPGVIRALENHPVGDVVEVRAVTVGTRSRSGQHYNNIVAKYIKPVTK